MIYRTLAAIKEDHPKFFERGARLAFGDAGYNKRGDCVIITQYDQYATGDKAGKPEYTVFDFRAGALPIGTFETFALAEAMAEHAPEMDRKRAMRYGRLVTEAKAFLDRRVYGESALVDRLHKWMMNARAGKVYLQALVDLCNEILQELPNVDGIAYALAMLESDD